jgi:uncharacterized membrane protein HdeD (DUF308 family)
MASRDPISVAGLLGIVIGTVLIASALYDPFDPNYCADGCGGGGLISRLMGWITLATNQWVARALLLVLGGVLVAKGWQSRWGAPKPRKTDRMTAETADRTRD